MGNKTDLKVAFFGTSDKSKPILESLKKHFNLALCITKTDTKVGRKQESRETEVKVWAKENEIPYLQISSLKNDDLAKVLEELNNRNIQIGIVADFNFMVPEEILSNPEFGLINIHFSLLPKYRGASPVQHAILNGENKTGVTFQIMDKGMDTGDIIYQFEHNLDGTETTESLYNTLFHESAEVLSKVISDYTGNIITPIEQNLKEASYCYSTTHPKSTYIYKEDAKIDWETTTINELNRMIRAYYPWPVAWTTLNEMSKGNIEINEKGIVSTNKPEISKNLFKSKTDKDLRVKIYEAVLINKVLEVKQIQVEGKNKMSWKDFLNGYSE